MDGRGGGEPRPAVPHPGGLPGQRPSVGPRLAARAPGTAARGRDDRHRGRAWRPVRLRGRADRGPAGPGRAGAGRLPGRRPAVRRPRAPGRRARAAVRPRRGHPRFAPAGAVSRGVLCTASGPGEQRAMLKELRRVLRESGRAGLLVFLATRDPLDDPPEGTHFPTRDQLTALLRDASLTGTAAADPASLPAPPDWWRERITAVEAELRRRFGDNPQLATALEQSHRIGQLLLSGELVSQVIIAVPLG